jgi:serine/tyrosine/threonine adenylyltransferase
MIPFEHSYARELVGCYAECLPTPVPAPELLYWNSALAAELGITLDGRDTATLAHIFSGNRLPTTARPIAQAYAGHQFGQFSPQLGDGRALLIGEIIDTQQQRRDIAFKGSGRTPFSRRGDGKAAIGPMLREALIGEAMHALGISTTRALAVVATGETIYRETPLPGAILTRVAASHLRVGTFEYFAARGEIESLKQLADYTLKRHMPDVREHPDRYQHLCWEVARRQARLVAQWMGVGFIHGVMNTDNMALSGETLDFGPCAFMESYHPATVFSSIDHHGRYAYGNQPNIAHWNLARFCETLLPLIHPDQHQAIILATKVVNAFPELFQQQWLRVARAKLGICDRAQNDQTDLTLASQWLELLQQNNADYTLAWRYLANAAEGNEIPLRNLLSDPAPLTTWLNQWRERYTLDNQEPSARATAIRQANPWIIPRNHRVEETLSAAAQYGDMAPFQRLLGALQQPYIESPAHADLAAPAPPSVTSSYKTFCGT